jgi:sarcosine oxidase subunit alpha
MSKSTRFENNGVLINRAKPLTFEFEGQQYQAFEGDTIASALLANGRWLMSRSFKYHRPRGPLTMAGQDANTLVQLAAEPNVLADMHQVTHGEEVLGQNYEGSLDKDRDAYMDKLGRFLPVGFYYRAFYKPLGIWDSWEKWIRKKAGLGVVDVKRDTKSELYDKQFLFHDIVVIGAGPAGLKAALTAAEAGANVLLVDENPYLGGALSYHDFIDCEAVDAESFYTQAVPAVEQHSRIDVLLNATCNGWFADNYLEIIQDKRLYKARAKQCIVASGSLEQHVVFRNNDLPGIALCSAVERMIKLYAIKPGQKAVVLAGNDDALCTAITLAKYGVVVNAVLDMRTDGVSSLLIQQLTSLNIPYQAGYTVYEALKDKKSQHLKAVDARQIVAQGKVAEKSLLIDCDLLCMSAGYMPTYQLLCQAGGKLIYDDESAQFKIEQLPAGLHIAGAVNSIHDLAATLADGERAAIVALGHLGLSEHTPADVICDKKTNFDWPIFKHPKAKEFVDFDEDLQIKDIINATKMGYRDVQLVKRFSTVGMGPSQGRHSALPTARLIAKATERSVSETGVTTARPPFAPEKLAHLAGRGYASSRLTPVHSRHLALNATMINVGGWQRPSHYGELNKQQAMHAEASHVRAKVGIMDVSTLGGIDVRGPDAAEFLNRFYSNEFRSLAVGKTRYTMLVNDQGVIADDGIASRLADDYFYLSASTSNATRVFREMTKCSVQWQLDVDLANVTSAFAKFNLAGPDARKVLSQVMDDISLSANAFPYLAFREGHIASIPVRIMRVGFVGELSYEVHVPAQYGETVWDMLMNAGLVFDIKPFGVAAQRLLRLEKGHFLVGQDTDGMTHPGEVDMLWALDNSKPVFSGKRSVEIVLNQQQKRKLVAFSLPFDSLKPEEGHLVLKGEAISGNVTSCEYSATLNKIIGLAYAAVDQSEVGSSIPIRVDGGDVVEATVVNKPFYDADDLRQEL